MNQLKCGVIGTGFIGFLHARVINQIPNAKLVAMADTNKEALKEAAASFGCETYESYEEMLAKADLDAVSVCTPASCT